MRTKMLLCWLLEVLISVHGTLVASSSMWEIAIDRASAQLPVGEKLHVVTDAMEFLRTKSQSEECEDSFHTVDIGTLVSHLQLWQKHLPRVTPHYAIKTNHDAIVVATLAGLGVGFDCASYNELKQVLDLGVDPAQIIFAHPRKPITSLKYAQSKGVQLMTFDSVEELEKMLTFAPEGHYLLRIATEEGHSNFLPLSSKFGASLAEARQILDAALCKNAPVVGVAFHVGSNTSQPEPYRRAILDAAELFNYAAEKWDVRFSVLDLGGGWPGNDDIAFEAIAKAVNETIDSHFDADVTCMAEPGRYFAGSTTVAAMRIVGKTSTLLSTGNKKFSYYLSNGAYGLFICNLYCSEGADAGWNFQPLSAPKDPQTLYPTRLWGPTCDSYDKIGDDFMLPELQSGDFIYTENIGAYAYSLQTAFNGITPSKPYYIVERSWEQLE